MRVVFVCLLVSVALASDVATRYKCGSDCDETKMQSSLPDADAMPTTFAPSVPVNDPSGLKRFMNDYGAHGNGAVDDRVLMAPHSENLKLRPSLDIPYVKPEDKPALRRPCNLDEVLELLRAIKHDYQVEENHDRQLHEAKSAGTLPLTAAKSALDTARESIRDLEAARDANATLVVTLETIDLKSRLLKQHMDEKAALIQEEGQLKAPIIKSIGRTNINLQAAVDAKQTALNDFAQHPAFTKDEIQQLLATYDELIASIKRQLVALHQEASDVLTPIQLNINQTQHAIDRVEAEINSLKSERDHLIPIAQSFSPSALIVGKAIEDNALQHFNTLLEAHNLDLKSFDQRSTDRSSILKTVDELLMVVSDIQQPQDVNDQEVAVPSSLAGAIAGKPAYTAEHE